MPPTLTENLDSLYSTTWQKMKSKAMDNIFTATPLFYWLYSAGRVERERGGKWLGVQLMYAKNATVASLGPGGTIDISNTDPLTTARFDWKVVAGSVIRLHSEDTENVDKASIMSLAQAKLKNLELSIIDALETMSHGDGTGNGSLDFDGLANLVSVTPAVGTIGGLNRATYSWWRNKQRDYSVTSMLSGDIGMLYNFRIMYNNCSVGNDHPTLIMCGQDVYELYEAAQVPALRIYDAKMADGGFDAMKFKGTTVTWSPSAAAATARFLNERYIKLVINSLADFEMTDWKPIPNQLDRVAQVVLKGNLVISNSRMHGVLNTIA